ncbi:hypothetical protein [Natranaerofaba carboxydovora]|uniref:hypothetical protein n=1 Tax=Natranaerofaba carboxydovora TaxID=2742683 RepID=UPI001F12B8FD|nr:hypothetical protein [Natranaerofaba carboxydovora]UMZ72552.1 hypothetical protein ACONDI_00073 [Natranaerofaba carboxydovora]
MANKVIAYLITDGKVSKISLNNMGKTKYPEMAGKSALIVCITFEKEESFQLKDVDIISTIFDNEGRCEIDKNQKERLRMFVEENLPFFEEKSMGDGNVKYNYFSPRLNTKQKQMLKERIVKDFNKTF